MVIQPRQAGVILRPGALRRRENLMRKIALALLAALTAVLTCAAPAAANPIPVAYLHDSPAGNPNGIWDDQWSGGTVFPEGEFFDVAGPYGVNCHLEENASIARIGSGEEALYVYDEPPFTGTMPAGYTVGWLSLRQTCWEMATIEVTLYKAGVNGCPPCEELLSTSQDVACSGWPPTLYVFDLGWTPEITMENERLLIVISTPNGQCTDIVWDCPDWPTWFEFPWGSPVNQASWGTIKALYK